jgi:hypothetical protein
MRDAKENLAAVGLLHNSADGGDGAADEALLTANHLSQLHDSPQATCHIQQNKLSKTNSAQQTQHSISTASAQQSAQQTQHSISTTNIQRRLPSAHHLSQLHDRAHRHGYKTVMPPPPPWARHVAVLFSGRTTTVAE